MFLCTQYDLVDSLCDEDETACQVLKDKVSESDRQDITIRTTLE